MTLNKMLEWLRKTDVPLTTISKKTNVSRKTLYNWINGGMIRNRSYEKVYNVYKQDIDLFNTDIPMEGDSNMEAQYIIDLQKEKIKSLERKLEQSIQIESLRESEIDLLLEWMLNNAYRKKASKMLNRG